MDEARVVEQARKQLGLITRRQALAAGLTEKAIRERVRLGAWTTARRGVFVVGAVPWTWEQQILAAVLAAGPDVVASHRSALRLWDAVKAAGRPELLVQGDRRVRVAGVQVHESILFPDIDRTTRKGVPATTLSRTIVDASARQDPRSVGIWIDEGMRRHHLDLRELRSCVARLLGPGRRNVRSVQAALSLRDPTYDPGDSQLEAMLLRALLEEGLPLPAQQHAVRRPDGSLAFLDLAYPEVMIAMEADGWGAHGSRSAFDPDRLRGNDITLLGWQLYRFTSTMSAAQFAAMIAAAYRRAVADGGSAAS